MRKLPIKKSPRHKLLIKAVFDFYGGGLKTRRYKEARQIALYLMGRKRRIKLSEGQMEDVWYIKQCLKDKEYMGDLSQQLHQIPHNSH